MLRECYRVVTVMEPVQCAIFQKRPFGSGSAALGSVF